jgi:hypothetical protein
LDRTKRPALTDTTTGVSDGAAGRRRLVIGLSSQATPAIMRPIRNAMNTQQAMAQRNQIGCDVSTEPG